MSRAPRAPRQLLAWVTLLPLLSACQSTPSAVVSISSKSSLLAVDVLFPAPMSRDPDLVQVFLVKGPVSGRMPDLPELVPATFVKNSRAYLLDPEPGTYSVVAVTAAVSPPWYDFPVAGGVTKTTQRGTIAHAYVFPAELVHRTRTTAGRSGVAFMGTLRIRQGDRVDADAQLQDVLQLRIADRVRPGATSASGLSSLFTKTWMIDLEETRVSREPADREAFFENALLDLDASPWTEVIARAASLEAPVERASAPAPAPRRASPVPVAVVAEPQAATPGETVASPPTRSPAPDPTLAAATQAQQLAALDPPPAPPPPSPSPKRRRVPGLPSDSPLAEIELGMSHDEVHRILGDPDEKLNRLTAKAWIPFYTGPGAHLRDWIYEGEGRVVFSLDDGALEVLDVVYDPSQRR